MDPSAIDKIVPVTVLGVERSTGDKVDGVVVDDLLFIAKIFGS